VLDRIRQETFFADDPHVRERTADASRQEFLAQYTFCKECTVAMNAVCPNCGGELVRRPRKKL
jgi:hypothetical protein